MWFPQRLSPATVPAAGCQASIKPWCALNALELSAKVNSLSLKLPVVMLFYHKRKVTDRDYCKHNVCVYGFLCERVHLLLWEKCSRMPMVSKNQCEPESMPGAYNILQPLDMELFQPQKKVTQNQESSWVPDSTHHRESKWKPHAPWLKRTYSLLAGEPWSEHQ